MWGEARSQGDAPAPLNLPEKGKVNKESLRILVLRELRLNPMTLPVMIRRLRALGFEFSSVTLIRLLSDLIQEDLVYEKPWSEPRFHEYAPRIALKGE